MSLEAKVNKYLKQVASSKGVNKGTPGEKAVFSICEDLYQRRGGILIHSYEYKVDPQLEGNIKMNEDGSVFVERLGSVTEIDVLYISKYRVFPIEVKAYSVAHGAKDKKIILTDKGISGCLVDYKSPVHQNEMHCRHLYSYIFRALPEGATKYVVPIVCFVDGCVIGDRRSPEQKKYIKVCTADELYDMLLELDTPIDYKINLSLMDKILKEAASSSEVWLPPRF